MNLDDLQGAYAHVDQVADPQAMVAHLDKMRAMDPFREVKRQNLALLALQDGARILDIGCGPGDDTRAISAIVGPTGRVVGIDNSETMVATARSRAEGLGLPVEYRVMDAARLDFGGDTFDGGRADRVFQHLPDPERALAEMVRVTRSGGTIVVSDTDWGMMAFDLSNREMVRWLTTEISENIPSDWVGRQLPRLFRAAGLDAIQVVPHVVMDTSGLLGPPGIPPEKVAPMAVARARNQGIITESEGQAFAEEWQTRVNDGTFFRALVMFTVVGRKS
jgi:ubiquinone/menaquinone biosynthesis C-methylase UbiE